MERIKKFKFQDREYSIEFPNVGQYMEIESNKLDYSNNKYSSFITSRTFSALRAVQIVECVSILSVLCPNLFKDMKVENYSEIDAKDFVELIKIYQKEISPWYSKWFNEFNKVFEDINKEDKKLKEEEKEVEK